jgi:DNA anti-recombination protein RmuC
LAAISKWKGQALVEWYKRISVSALVVGTAWTLAAACGRSENIGWAGRDIPDSVAAFAAAVESLRDERAAQAEVSALTQEYQQLSGSLQQVQMQALSEPEFSRQWNDLVNEADAAILARSAFHRGLQDRRLEIERIMQQPDTLSEERQGELAQNYRNIQLEMARIRNEEFRKPAIANRFLEFQRALFARMRELAPERRADIDRLLEIEEQAFVPIDTTPPVPGMQPVR